MAYQNETAFYAENNPLYPVILGTNMNDFIVRNENCIHWSSKWRQF